MRISASDFLLLFLFLPVMPFGFQCLPDPNNYHEFCRLLARLKSNYQLGELVKVENYPEVIRLIANFTVTSLQVGAVHRVYPAGLQVNATLRCIFSNNIIVEYTKENKTKKRHLNVVHA